MESPAFTRSSNGFKVTKITPTLGALVKVAPSNPANATACVDAGPLEQHVRCLAHELIGSLEARARRQRERGNEVGAVKRRDKACWCAGKLEIRETNEPAIDH